MLTRYRVECVDRNTGKMTYRVFEAANAEAATVLANSMGYMTGQVVAEDQALRPKAAVAGTISVGSGFRVAVPKRPVIPDYSLMKTGGHIIQILGAVVVGLAILLGIVGLLTLLLRRNMPHVPSLVATVAPAMLYAALSALCGVAVMGLGQAILALRDMAINSWHIRYATDGKAG
jgi:hypothetical protein